MGVQISHESVLGKELAKWEQHRTKLVPDDVQPGNPYVFRPYPKMLYRAMKRPNGKAVVLEPMPMSWDFSSIDQFQNACIRVETQNAQCYCKVGNESEELIRKGQGWCATQGEAMELFEREQDAIAEEAARVAFTAKRMSPEAQAELEAANDSTTQHVVDIAGGSKKTRRSRRPKAVTGVGVLETD